MTSELYPSLNETDLVEQVKEQCIVLFPYTALNDDELTLREGQIITIITKEVEDKGWWKGELDGKVGVFPDNFVKTIQTNSAQSQKSVSASPNAEEVTKKKPPFKSGKDTPAPAKPTGNTKASAINLGGSGKRSSFKSLDNISTNSNVMKTATEGSRRGSVNSNSGNNSRSQSPKTSREKANMSVKVEEDTSSKRPASKGVPPTKPKPPSLSSKPISALQKYAHKSSSEEKEKDEKKDEDKVVTDDLFDSVSVSSERLAHPTRLRAKAPNRRPPSSVISKDFKSREGSLESSLEPISTGFSKQVNSSLLSRSLEDMAADSNSNSRRNDPLSKSMHEKNSNFHHGSKNRLSFKLVRQVKDVFGGLTNGTHHGAKSSSPKASEETPQSTGTRPENQSTANVEAIMKKPPPPKPPAPHREETKFESKNQELIVPKSEELKKPEWLEELNRKQATRKSVGLIKDSASSEGKDVLRTDSSPTVENKPHLPVKPSQIKEEARKSHTFGSGRPSSLESSENSNPAAKDSSSSKEGVSTVTATDTIPVSLIARRLSEGSSRVVTQVKHQHKENIKKSNEQQESKTDRKSEIDVDPLNAHHEKMKIPSKEIDQNIDSFSLLERVIRLEKEMVDAKADYDERLRKLGEELEIEREMRRRLEDEVKRLEKSGALTSTQT